MKKLISFLSFVLLSFSMLTYANDLKLGMYELNRGEFKAAIAQFEPLVAEGYSPAEYQMGLVYLNGWGVQKSPQKAFELFSSASEKNYPDAQFELSLMYSDGVVTQKDNKKAFQLMKNAATKGLASAQFNLGVMYYQGIGVAQDDLQASRWYKTSAEQNYALAQFNLALLYFEGKGVEKSIEKSYMWNIIAAQNGYPDAATSRDMDEHKLDSKQIIVARDEARELYNKLVRRADNKAKMESQVKFL